MPKLKNSIATSLLHAFLSSAVTTKSVQAFQSSQTHIVCAHDCIYIIPRHDPKLVFVIFNIYYSKMSHDDHILWYGGGKTLESSRMMIRVSSPTTSAVISYNIHTSTQYTYICVSKKGGRDIHGVGGWRFGQTSWLDGPCNNNMYFGDKKQSEANLEECDSVRKKK